MKTFAIVTDVVYDRDRKRATGVRVMDAVTKATTEYSAPRGVPVRVGAQLHVAADAIGHRRVARRAGQQLGRAGPQPDGSPLPLRRRWHHRRAAGPDGLRPAADGLLHPAVPELFRRQARIPARLRLPGRRQPAGMGARGRGARRRRVVQGRDVHAGPVADGRHGVRRDAAEPRQQGARSIQRRPTSGAFPCWRSTARPARTNG